MTRHRRQIEEDSPLAYAGPHEWMREARKLTSAGLIAAAALGGVGLYVHETTKGSHPKKEAEPATEPISLFPDTAFLTNFNLDELNNVVIDKQGRVKGESVFPGLRADQVNMTAICEKTDKSLFRKPEKTIVIYKAKPPKTGFAQIEPSLGQQTSIKDISRYSQTFPGTFSSRGHIGAENAETLAVNAHQNPCEGEGRLWGYKDQQITPLIPATEQIEPIQPNIGEAAVFAGIIATIGAVGYGSYRLLKRKFITENAIETPHNPDIERAEQTSEEDSVYGDGEEYDERWGVSKHS